jgi:hypothetical protein
MKLTPPSTTWQSVRSADGSFFWATAKARCTCSEPRWRGRATGVSAGCSACRGRPGHCSTRTQKVARELLISDPLESVKAYRSRALVVSAARDVQVPISDGDRIFSALSGAATARVRTVIADANHVYKKETRDPASMPAAELVKAYAEDGRALADGSVDVIVAFVSVKQSPTISHAVSSRSSDRARS